MASVSASANALPPQPNFDALSRHLQGMSLEVGRCSNLVAVREANATVDGFTSLQQSIDRLTESFNTAVAGLTTQVANLTTQVADIRRDMADMGDSFGRRLDDFDFNNRARVLNSTATRPDGGLLPLRNTTTHELVELPATVAHLNALTGVAIDELLRALGQEPAARHKKSQLKAFIGVIGGGAKEAVVNVS
ncbi:hypothetical protein EKO27_g4169 [Xylaria grammica]|uniref:Uncharacterized protein n=1 Tax=Xylaria grammica TaxID=363999 RepID=A0A439D961_9PEZI|nr:hypothetical protein EKO27_g4169 [Xylaria grammica]